MSGDIGLSAEHSSRVNVTIINTVVMTMRLGCRENYSVIYILYIMEFATTNYTWSIKRVPTIDKISSRYAKATLRERERQPN